MKKADIFGNNRKERLKASARDRSYSFVMNDGMVRGCMVNATTMVKEMRTNHQLGILETLVLGHSYIAGILIASGLKGNDRISLQIDCSGPIKGLVVEANSYGEVRGHLKKVPILINKPLDDFNLSPFFGAGFLSVTKYLEDAKQPFTGQVELQYGSIAKDLTYYYSQSEQTPSAIILSIQFDSDGEVVGAGGLLVQVMPGADDQTIDGIEGSVKGLPSLGEYFSENKKIEDIIHDVFKHCNPKILANHRVEFMCHCNEDRMKNYLLLLPANDIADLSENGPFPMELICHHCNTKYYFSQQELKAIQQNRKKM
ncbi:MAG: Hsp33 family molecular chaperone HslO [Desulfobacterium sp.]|nr:Hsp33 family molecular chaperone HslO [Desulfobacterium sp.]